MASSTMESQSTKELQPDLQALLGGASLLFSQSNELSSMNVADDRVLLHFLSWEPAKEPWKLPAISPQSSSPLFRWAEAMGYDVDENASDIKTLSWLPVAAAVKGDLELLKLCKAAGCSVDRTVADMAAAYGHIHIIRWWDQINEDDRYRYQEAEVAMAAAAHGQINVLDWLEENNYPIKHYPARDYKDISVEGCAAYFGQIEALEWLVKRGIGGKSSIVFAAAAGRIDILQWCEARGYIFDETVTAAAARAGQFSTLQWLREHGCPWTASTSLCAAVNGNAEMVKWTLVNGCPYIPAISWHVMRAGHTELLRWLHAQGYSLESNVFYNAVELNDIPFLEWLFSIGVCPPINILSWAVQLGKIPVVQFLREKSCEYDDDTFAHAILFHPENKELQEWLIANGCPNENSLAEAEELNRMHENNKRAFEEMRDWYDINHLYL